MKKDIVKIFALVIISILLAIILEVLIMQEKSLLPCIGKIVINSILITYLGAHIVFKFKKTYDFLEKYKFLISIILIVVFSIAGYLINSLEISMFDWITNTEKILAPWWNIKFFGLLITLYELFLIITKNNKYLSISGSYIITFSGFAIYNFNKIDAIMFGSLFIVLLNKLLKNNENRTNIFYSILIIFCSICYSYTFIPYAVSFGYVFLALTIFVLMENKEFLKKDKVKYIMFSFILSVLGIIITKFIYANNYIENMESISISGISLIFSYLYSCFIPFKNVDYKEILNGLYSIAPFPMLIALYYTYKKENHLNFLLPVCIVTVLETVFCLSGFPSVLAKILLLENVSASRMVLAVQFSNLLIIYYFIANIKENLFSIKIDMRITLIFIILLALIAFPEPFNVRIYLIIFTLLETAFTFIFLNVEEAGYRKVLVILLLICSLISGLPAYIII